MKRKEAIHELQEDKRLYETEVCHAGDGSPDGRLLEALDMAIEALSTERTGEWIDCQEYGYVECPFCGHATNCEDNKDELHFCFYCGAKTGGSK